MSSALSFLLCVIALGLATCFPAQDRRMGVYAALGLGLNWAACEWTFTPWSPHALIGLSGTYVWAVMDLIPGCLIALRQRRWLWALWGVSMVQEVVHFLYFSGVPGAELYLRALDGLFLIQVAVFMAEGGRGVGDMLHSGALWLRSLGRPPRSSAARIRDEAP